MKKIIFWILAIISVLLAFNIAGILIYDINRLTEYGFGYLTGITLMFLIIIGLTVFAGFKAFKKN
jgi:amino acid permease